MSSRFKKILLKNKSLDKHLCIIILIFIFSTIFLLAPWIHGNDGAGYYALTRSIVVDKNINISDEQAFFSQDRDLRSIRKDKHTDNYYSQYPVGTSIMWLPAECAAHGLSILLNKETSGYTRLYYWFINFESALLAFIALIFGYSFLKREFDEKTAFYSVISGWLATNLFYYMFFEGSMSHAISFFLITIFIIKNMSLEKEKSYANIKNWFVLGILAGMIFITRFQDGVVWLMPALLSLYYYLKLFQRRNYNDMKKLFMGNLIFLLAIFLIVSLQVFINLEHNATLWRIGTQYYDGVFIGSQWWFFIKVMFSSNHGLFFWTPVALLGFFGLMHKLYVRKTKRIYDISLFLIFLIQIIITGFWSDWNGAQSFSHRFLTGYLFIIIYGLALLQNNLSIKKTKITRIIFIILILINFSIMMQYSLRMISVESNLDIWLFITNHLKFKEIITNVIVYLFSKTSFIG